jgi:hypothetical protein
MANFTLVPEQFRVLVCCIVSLFWNIYLTGRSLVQGKRQSLKPLQACDDYSVRLCMYSIYNVGTLARFELETFSCLLSSAARKPSLSYYYERLLESYT